MREKKKMMTITMRKQRNDTSKVGSEKRENTIEWRIEEHTGSVSFW
jgi:hypothetical protein